ncbi:nitroreductase family protein [Actinospongicola halichondriae]|uniref:nitroreductase family protein n=1 Tax=Actinospongicola halichondriae TaxID=3236844 RepID=UPI003D4EDA38
MADTFTPPTLDEALERLEMPLVDAMMTQRAVRRLHPDPVDPELIRRLLALALKAPTSSNSQDWSFLVITGVDQKRALGDLYAQLHRRMQPVERWLARNDEARQRQMRPGEWQMAHFDEIPLFVIPCYRRNLKHRPVGRPQISVSSYYGSVYPAVQNLLLGCRAVGLGASLQTLPIWRVPAARKILDLPRSMNPVCIIPIGWAKGKYGPTTRPDVADVLHVDRYGNQPTD